VQAGPRLSCADYAFPLLRHDDALQLIARLGFRLVDLGLFAGRTHLRPEVVLDSPAQWVDVALERLSKAGLGIADVFGTPSESASELAINHPDGARREQAVAFVERLTAFARSIGAGHVTVLPGVAFPGESRGAGLARSAGTLRRCLDIADGNGVTLAIEPHVDSIVETPEEVGELLTGAPGLTLTLDPAHFVYQGVATAAVLPLVEHASHLQLRAAAPGRMQVPLRENEVDLAGVMAAASAAGYGGALAIEYVWMTHWDCDRVDNLSETIQLANLVGDLANANPARPSSP
jgi:sugar phosphate isomerase/epimerase